MISFGLICLGFGIALAIPLLMMRANNQFVGQRKAPRWAKTAMMLLTSLGAGWAFVSFVWDRLTQLQDHQNLPELGLAVIAIAWVIGSCVTALVALQEYGENERRPDDHKELT